MSGNNSLSSCASVNNNAMNHGAVRVLKLSSTHRRAVSMDTNPITDQTKLDQRLKPVLESLERFDLMDSLHDRQRHPQPEVEANLLHRQQDAELSRRLATLNGADVAQLLEMLPGKNRYRVWDNLVNRAAGDAVVEVAGRVAKDLIAATPEQRLMTILDTLSPDQISALKSYIGDAQLARFKQRMAEQARRQLEQSSSFPAESVGALMKHDFITLPVELSVREAVQFLRDRSPLPDQTDQLFVQDEFFRFVGAVRITDLLLESPERLLRDIARRDVICFEPRETGKQAAQAFERYNLISSPVLDARQQLQGRLTVDSVMDYVRRQAEGQALASAGLREDTDLFAPVWNSAKERWPWLAINLLTAFAATRFIAIFEPTLERIVSLAVLMPIIASVGGNTGNQTIALFVRGLALDQIKRGNTRFLVRKELSIGLINGALWGSLLAIVATVVYRDIGLGLVMMAAMTLNLLVGALVGTAVPLLAHALGRDPAVGTSVILTFTTDSMGFFIFLGLATVFLL
jgi:magnesium transporter